MQATQTTKPNEKTRSHLSAQPAAESPFGAGQEFGASAGIPLFLQPKLAISQPDDPYEQEADRVAEQVVRMPASAVQRQCAVCAAGRAPCPKCEAEAPVTVSRKAEGALAGEAPTSVHSTLCSPGQPLASSTRAFFEPRFAQDLSHVRVHTNGEAQKSAREVNALAYTVGSHVVFGTGRYVPGTPDGQRLLAHELTHVVQQSGGDGFGRGRSNAPGGLPSIFSPAHGLTAHGGTVLQRDLALEPTNPHPQDVNLSAAQIRDAINFNRLRYDEENTRLIQDVVGATQTGVFDEDTIRLIARYQDDFGLTPVDGKVGPDTFDQLTSELQAENVDDQTCLTMFNVSDPMNPLDIRVAGPGLADIFSRFNMTARFSPHCNCEEFDYRQFICGSVDRTRAGAVTNMNNVFSIPGGGLPQCPGWVEDGNTAQAQNGRYGHRNHTARVNNRYLDDTGAVDMTNGCRFEAFDVPGLFGVPGTSGDRYDFDIRFFGDVRRNGRRIQRKFWAVRDNITIP
jgi:hypothetical protein